MNNSIKGFICGFVVAAALIAGSSAFADSILLKTIDVAENLVNIKVNGVFVNVPNYVQDGRTYVQLRYVSELLGKDVSWNGNTNTANIEDKNLGQPLSENEKSSLNTQEIAQKGNAVVLIKTFNKAGQGIGQGSGFILTSDGTVITNYHVIDGADRVQVILTDGRTFNAGSVKYDSQRDIAALKLNGANSLPVVALGDSSNVQLGESVVAIGNPEGLQNVVSEGIISTISRIVNGKDYIQITAPISPGSSGGALFNSQGEVIGITSAKLTNGESLNFAIPINYVKAMI